MFGIRRGLKRGVNKLVRRGKNDPPSKTTPAKGTASAAPAAKSPVSKPVASPPAAEAAPVAAPHAAPDVPGDTKFVTPMLHRAMVGVTRKGQRSTSQS